MEIVLATHNPDKCIELLSMFKGFDINFLTLNDFPEIGEIIEDGKTLKENALIKANTVFNYTKLPSIADDTGLAVEALNGQPGIYSARYAGDQCSYIANVKKILKTMQGIPIKDRNATFKTVIAYVDENKELTCSGEVQGVISTLEKGVNGFGYDSIFYIPSLGKTYAELSMDKKNQISHRAKAIKNIKDLLHKSIPDKFYTIEKSV